jgi:hypothetical protein
MALYGNEKYGGGDNFKIMRDNDIFNSVLVSVGRFGIVYSVIMHVVRQYSLRERRRVSIPDEPITLADFFTWNEVKKKVTDLTSDLYHDPPENRFLQIAVNVTPFQNFHENIVGITKRWNVPFLVPPPLSPLGRAERVGLMGPFDAQLQAPRFSQAGNSHPYSQGGVPISCSRRAQTPTSLWVWCRRLLRRSRIS